MRSLRSSVLSIVFLLAACSFVALAPSPAIAGGSPLTVDRPDDDPTATACTAVGQDDCSLRGAITAANSTPASHNEIILADLTYTLDEAGTEENLNTTGDLDVLGPITLTGNGAHINGGGVDRVMHVNLTDPQTTVAINEVFIGFGNEQHPNSLGALGGGGLLLEAGVVNVTDSDVLENHTETRGGGISIRGAVVTLSGVQISDNTADGAGGGIAVEDINGSLFIQGGSLIAGNTGNEGGGIVVGLHDQVSISDTEISGNTATFACPGVGCGDGGGGIAVFTGGNQAEITNSSIIDNDSNSSGGGLLALSEIHVSSTEIAENTAAQTGGGVLTLGNNTTISNADIHNNSATRGGGIAASSSVISNTSVTANEATGDGGGIFLQNNNSIDHSLIYDNTTGDEGGGIAVGGGTNALINTTITGNRAANGGGIAKGQAADTAFVPQGGPNPGPLNLSFVTIADNTAASGANIFNDDLLGPVVVGSSIIAYPLGGGSDCNVPIQSNGYNVEEGTSCGLTGTEDIDGVDPLLQPLADNGGPTETRALSQGSPAVDHGTPACPPPDDDQRGVARAMGTGCDAGAFESTFSATPGPSPTETPAPTVTTTPGPSPTPTPDGTSTPTPAGTPGTTATWGDNNCADGPNPVDGLFALRFDAGLATNTGACPEMGQEVAVVGFSFYDWGDVDCNGTVDPVDGLKLLRFDAGLNVVQEQPCPLIGDEVFLEGFP